MDAGSQIHGWLASRPARLKKGMYLASSLPFGSISLVFVYYWIYLLYCVQKNAEKSMLKKVNLLVQLIGQIVSTWLLTLPEYPFNPTPHLFFKFVCPLHPLIESIKPELVDQFPKSSPKILELFLQKIRELSLPRTQQS